MNYKLYPLPLREKDIKLQLNGSENWERWCLVKAITGNKRGPGHCKYLCIYCHQSGSWHGSKACLLITVFIREEVPKGLYINYEGRCWKAQETLWTSFEKIVGEPGKCVCGGRGVGWKYFWEMTPLLWVIQWQLAGYQSTKLVKILSVLVSGDLTCMKFNRFLYSCYLAAF